MAFGMIIDRIVEKRQLARMLTAEMNRELAEEKHNKKQPKNKDFFYRGDYLLKFCWLKKYFILLLLTTVKKLNDSSCRRQLRQQFGLRVNQSTRTNWIFKI
jgi:hypothetical protein